MAGKPEAKSEDAAAPKPAQAAGGLKPWLPLIANLVLMPVMAYLTITLVASKSHKAATVEAKAAASEKGEARGEAKGEEKDKGETGVKGERFYGELKDKILVNVQGTQMSRYLIAKIVLEGNSPAIKDLVEKNDVELRDVAGSVLMGKTIPDLDKPGAKNLIRAELLVVFRNVLGQDAVKQVLLTEYAVQ
jgi:flagellar basal body-associated protein FliL